MQQLGPWPARLKTLKYLVSERQSHDGDQKAKERLQFSQTCKEKEAVSVLGRAEADFPSRIPPEELPYLSRKRNKKVSAMVMSTPPHSGILQAVRAGVS